MYTMMQPLVVSQIAGPHHASVQQHCSEHTFNWQLAPMALQGLSKNRSPKRTEKVHWSALKVELCYANMRGISMR